MRSTNGKNFSGIFWIMEQSFGALSTIAICAGGVMGLPLLISDYRQKKILKRYKVTPTSPAFLLEVWVTIYAIYSILSLCLVFGVLTIFFGCRFNGAIGIFLFMYLLVMLSMFSIGLMVGGVVPDTKGNVGREEEISENTETTR